MGINPNADVPGLRPENFLGTHPQTFEIVEAPKKTDGRFSMLLKDNDGKKHRIAYLWERDLADLARHYGGEDEQVAAWVGKRLNLRAEQKQSKKDGKFYANFIITAWEQVPQ